MHQIRKYLSAINVIEVSIIAICFSLLIAMFSKTFGDPDLWGHVKFGQDTLQAGCMITVDKYSYLTSGVKWINHEWLAEIITALAYKAGGIPGICFLRLSLDFSVLLLLYLSLRSARLSAAASAVVLVLAGLLLFPGMSTMRPQTYTDLALVIELLIIKAADKGNYRALLFLPLLFMFWVNMHGGFLAGIFCLTVWAAAHWAVKIWRVKALTPLRSSSFVITVLAIVFSWAALTLNPYGAELIKIVFSTIREAQPDEPEWGPIALFDWPGIAYMVAVVISFYSLFASKKKLSPALLLTFLPFAGAPLLVRRHLQLFAIAMVVLLGDQFADLQEQFSVRFTNSQTTVEPRLAMKILVGCLSFVVTVAALIFSLIDINHLIVTNKYPFSACKMLANSSVAGNLAVDPMYWGEFVIWRLSPKLKVSYDGRRENCYTPAMRQMNEDFDAGSSNWDKLLNDYPTDLALVLKNRPCFNRLMLKADWCLIYEDALCGVFARNDFAKAHGLQAH